MKKTISLLAVLLLATPTTLLPAAPASTRSTQPQAQITPLTNRDVTDMIKAGLSAAIITAKIKSSTTNFDTSPAAMQQLKADSVPDVVILSMVESSTGSGRSVVTTGSSADTRTLDSQSSQVLQEVVLPDGLELTVVTTEELSSKTATEGDPLTLKVDEDVMVNGRLVIAKGTLVKASVSSAEKSGRLGKGGKLGIRIESTMAVDNQKVQLRASKGNQGGDKTGTTVALVALFGPLGFLKKGKNAVIKEGTKIKAYTDQEKKVQVKS